MQKIYKYPRTYHLDGSGIQHGDEDLSVISVGVLAGRHVLRCFAIFVKNRVVTTAPINLYHHIAVLSIFIVKINRPVMPRMMIQNLRSSLWLAYYLDAPLETILHRNRERSTSAPEAVMNKLLDKLDVPDLTEAHMVFYENV